jgi:hypothetical protein
MVSSATLTILATALTKTPEYPFREMEKAYTTFKAAAENAALKMLISM